MDRLKAGRAATGSIVERPNFEVINPDGCGDFVLVCEHASNAVPAEFSGLGLSDHARNSHIAWDPGALPVARALSQRLDAPLVAARVSRLVYDCNRPPDAADAIAVRSDGIEIPGNSGLSDDRRRARVETYYEPFRHALAACLEARMAGTHPPILITVHSFTPVYAGVRREVGLGVVHDRDRRYADAFLRSAVADAPAPLRRNEPYGPADGVTHTLLTHGVSRALPNVMLEIRNDLIATAGAQRSMAAWLAAHAEAARDRMLAESEGRLRACR